MTRALSRRTFLRGTGVALALPWLDAMTPWSTALAAEPGLPLRRMVCMNLGLSLHPPFFFPTENGPNYKLTPYLEILKDFRNDFTVFSGLYHPGMEASGGHHADVAFLTGAPGVGLPTFKNRISLDQLVAEKIGLQTRLPYLGGSQSVNRNGVSVGNIGKPSQVFAELFLQGSKEEVQRQKRRLQQGQSILDVVRGQLTGLERKVAHGDRDKLDEYFGSLREVERGLKASQEWAEKDKPDLRQMGVDARIPEDAPANACKTLRLYLDLIYLAFRTDSTRLYTAGHVHWGVPPLPGVTWDHHNLSHNGMEPEKIKQLCTVDSDVFLALRDFMTKLKNTKEEGQTLLERTMILLGSHMHSGGHGVTNLPIVLAGGGFKHGQHLAFDNKPLSNLYVMMLRQFGLQIDTFGTSNGTIPGLQTVS